MLLPLSKMKRLKKLYQKYIYGIIGTLLFHVILFSGFLLSTVHQKTKHNEAPIVIDFSKSIEKPEEKKPETSKKKQLDAPDRPFTERSNQAVNDANPTKNKKPFFDKQYEDELKSARQLAANVNKQLHKKIPRLKDLKMPEETTEGQNPDSISSTIYSGQSNIHYDLKNRYHGGHVARTSSLHGFFCEQVKLTHRTICIKSSASGNVCDRIPNGVAHRRCSYIRLLWI